MSSAPAARAVETSASAADLPAALFERARPPQSRDRLLALEEDGRFPVRYLSTGEVALAVYAPVLDEWSDPAYDPARRLDGGTSVPEEWALAGGRADLRSALLVAPSVPAGEAVEAGARLVAAAAEDARTAGRHLALSYLDDGSPLHEAVRRLGPSRSAELGRRAAIPDVGTDLGSYLELLDGRRRSIVRRDLRDLERAEVVATPAAWAGVIDEAAPLVHRIHARHGEPDHPLLVADRLERWDENPAVETVAFELRRDGRLAGVSLGWRHGEALELYEIGLSEELGQLRRLCYFEIMFYAPLRFAWAHGVRRLELGLSSEEPKQKRGALLRPVLLATFEEGGSSNGRRA
jgi:uncharacterized protein